MRHTSCDTRQRTSEKGGKGQKLNEAITSMLINEYKVMLSKLPPPSSLKAKTDYCPFTYCEGITPFNHPLIVWLDMTRGTFLPRSP